MPFFCSNTYFFSGSANIIIPHSNREYILRRATKTNGLFNEREIGVHTLFGKSARILYNILKSDSN